MGTKILYVSDFFPQGHTVRCYLLSSTNYVLVANPRRKIVTPMRSYFWSVIDLLEESFED